MRSDDIHANLGPAATPVNYSSWTIVAVMAYCHAIVMHDKRLMTKPSGMAPPFRWNKWILTIQPDQIQHLYAG